MPDSKHGLGGGSAGVHAPAAGMTALSGPALRLFSRLDSRFRRVATRLGCDEARVPTLIAASELAKIDYFASFPHQCTFAVTLDEARDNLETFASGTRPDESGAIEMPALAPVRFALTPAACYHAYVQNQGRTLRSPLHWTTLGNCFRRETSYEPLRRQWSFAMREWVCLGTELDVTRFLRTACDEVESLMRALELPFEWHAATDPFFDPSRSAQYVMQKLSPLKTELTYTDGLAIGSVNFHRDFLGRAFEIHAQDAPAFSGCVAFGLERWVFAVLDCFGSDEAHWPPALREQDHDV